MPKHKGFGGRFVDGLKIFAFVLVVGILATITGGLVMVAGILMLNPMLVYLGYLTEILAFIVFAGYLKPYMGGLLK